MRGRLGSIRLFGALLYFGLRLRLEVRHILSVEPPQPDRDILIDRAGVRLFFRDAQFGEPVQDFVSLDFQLSCQLVDPNLLHR